MAIKVPKLSPEQLKVYQAIQAERRAWVALCFIFALVGVGFAAFVYAAFFEKAQTATIISGGIEGIFGWQLKQVYQHIYPSKSS